jgi:Holliday junction resolvase-like predicted endonuclease
LAELMMVRRTMMIYNFRWDRRRSCEVLKRIKEDNLLSQGWGGGEQCDLRVDQPDFVAKCWRCYGLASTRVPTSLTKMRGFKDGDVLVTPHLPEEGKVSIHLVTGDFPACYDYLKGDPTHLNHRIRLRESYGFEGTISVRNIHLSAWCAKLAWLRLPIQAIPGFEAAFWNILDELRVRPQARFDISGMDEYFGKLLADLLELLRKKLDAINPSGQGISFEAVCERLLTSAGYRIEGRNEYDRVGGDIDLRCVRDRSDASPFETGQTVLFVQVKKHKDKTNEQAVQQLLQMAEKEPEADACVMSLADGFSEKAKELAEENGVLLMNGEAICKLLLNQLAGRAPGRA